MKSSKKIKVGVSIGDLNGIGGELIVKTFEDKRVLEFCTPIIYASIKTMTFFKQHFSSAIHFNVLKSIDQVAHSKINVINVWNNEVKIEFGKETTQAGRYAIASLEAAVQDLKTDKIDMLLTAPIHKHNIQTETFKFPGHTDYLNQELDGQSLMFMISDNLRVGLLTDHVPLSEISTHINEDLIRQKIDVIHQSLEIDFGIRSPKIAVLGINPHTGDNGVIGTEDDTLLRPVIQSIKASGKLVYGPYAADSFFGTPNFLNFDAIVASYHDQGLIPFKTLTFGKGVNFTAGLDKIRVSPDHGTAFDIAGKGIANTDSFKQALFSGLDIYKTRKMNLELYANPLKISKKEGKNKTNA